MRVVIVGVNHALQTPGPGLMTSGYDPAPELADKQLFAELLSQLARTRGVVVVAEEQMPGSSSLPREVATKLRLQHECVEMPCEQRRARGIPDDYSTDSRLPRERVEAFHSLREAYWVERLEATVRPDDTAILVCGLDHLRGAREKLESRGHAVEVIDVRNGLGFDLAWLSHYPHSVLGGCSDRLANYCVHPPAGGGSEAS